MASPRPRGGVTVVKIDLDRLRELVAQQLDASTRELHERLGADCSLSAGAIVAIVLGALLVAGGLGAYVVLLIRRSLRP